MTTSSLFIMVVVTVILAEAGTLGKDVCFLKTSHLSCAKGEVIMMTSAEYGHMEGGECIEEIDPRYRGCRSDVRPLFDRWCSGRQECNFDTGDNELEKMNANCPKFIVKVTRLHHTCVKVNYVCSSHGITDKEGSLSSYITHKRGCGSDTSPWIISANPGQIVQLELIDFSSHKQDSNIISCRSVYGFVLERSLGINHTICSGSQRETALYTSKTNAVEVQFLKGDRRGEGEFLVKFKVIGCAELSPPHAWYKREGNKAIIGCEDNDKEWTVTCIMNEWKGDIGNCTKTGITKTPSVPEQKKITFTSVVIMAGIIGVAVVLSVIAVVVGVVYIKKYGMHQETKRAALAHKTYSTMDRNLQAYYRPVTMDQSADNRTLWDIRPSTHPEANTLSSADQCTCATLQMRDNVDNDKRTEITSLERQSLYSSIKSN